MIIGGIWTNAHTHDVTLIKLYKALLIESNTIYK